MKKEDFFENCKKGWKGRKEDFDTDQMRGFRKIKDRKNLEKA